MLRLLFTKTDTSVLVKKKKLGQSTLGGWERLIHCVTQCVYWIHCAYSDNPNPSHHLDIRTFQFKSCLYSKLQENARGIFCVQVEGINTQCVLDPHMRLWWKCLLLPYHSKQSKVYWEEKLSKMVIFNYRGIFCTQVGGIDTQCVLDPYIYLAPSTPSSTIRFWGMFVAALSFLDAVPSRIKTLWPLSKVQWKKWVFFFPVLHLHKCVRPLQVFRLHRCIPRKFLYLHKCVRPF